MQFVRSFKRSALLQLIARVAPQVSFNKLNIKEQSLITPWGLADVARVTLASGGEHNRRLPSLDDLGRCLALHNNLDHPGMDEAGRPGLARSMFLQAGFCQLPFQRQIGNLTGRSLALFDQTRVPNPSRLKVLVGDWQGVLLGCSLSAYMGVAQLLLAAAEPNHGTFNPAWLEDNGPPVILEHFPPEITRQVLEDNFVAHIDSYRERDGQQPGPARRFTFNPLQAKPLVSGVSKDLIMPVPDYITWKPTATGLYFTGLDRWGTHFATDLGWLFQAYVGRNLELIPRATLHPETSYGPRSHRRDSVDWIVVFDGLVVLIEAKSARPTEQARLGVDAAEADFRKAFDKANQQIEETLSQILNGTPEFSEIPKDRPFVGLVVTLEDFLVANSAPHKPMYSSSTKLPTFAVSIAELEQIVCLTTASNFLHHLVAIGPHVNIQDELSWSHFELDANPILRAGVEATPINRITASPRHEPEAGEP